MQYFFLILFTINVATFNALDQYERMSEIKTNTASNLNNSMEFASYITKGKKAARKQFPYLVGILDKGRAKWCGGTLISNRWIITAAHCLTEMTDKGSVVFLGAWNIAKIKEKGQRRVNINKKNVIIHQGYSLPEAENDIALIKLDENVTFSDYIKPATLPKLESSGDYDSYAEAMAFTSGWGSTSGTSNFNTNIVRWLEVPVLSNNACANMITAKDWVIPSRICADAKGGRSVCYGDSGGPLVLANDSRTLIGIASFVATKDCEKGLPGIFTRITYFLPWIKENSGISF